MPVLPLIKRTGRWFSAKLIQEKMDNLLGYIILIALAIVVAYTVSIFGKMHLVELVGTLIKIRKDGANRKIQVNAKHVVRKNGENIRF